MKIIHSFVMVSSLNGVDRMAGIFFWQSLCTDYNKIKTMDSNLTYEMFIRRSWDVDRFKKGANTDTWQGLLMDNQNYSDSSGASNIEKMRLKFEKTFSKVKKYISDAFVKLIAKAEKAAIDADDIVKLRQLAAGAEISENPTQLYGIIRQSYEIIVKHNL